MSRKRRCQVLSAFLIGLVAAFGGLAPQLPIPLDQPGEVRAADEVVTICDATSFEEALDAVQLDGGGAIYFDCDGPVTIQLSDQQSISTPVRISSAQSVTLRGAGNHRLFEVTSTGTLELIGLTLVNGSVTGNGGAISNLGTLIVTASTFTGNTATNRGGAIYNDLGGSVTVTASDFSGNTGTAFGGAIANFGGGQVTVTASRFVDNSSNNGGAIANSASGSEVTVLSSTFSENTGREGGAIINSGFGGTVTITASTFNDNTATSWGGAIRHFAGTTTVQASTFSGNHADHRGGAIHHQSGTTTVRASTFSGNSASNSGGAIFSDGTNVTLSASILVDSTAGNNCAGLIDSAGYNLADDTACSLTDTGDTQDVDVDAKLSALEDYGGPTPTMLPGEDSNALGAIPDSACASVSTTHDQRGVERSGGDDCDIGAVELGDVPVEVIVFTPLNLPEYEGDPVELLTIAYGPDNEDLDYTFDCAGDGFADDAAITSQGTDLTFTCDAADDNATLAVQVCAGGDATTCDTATISLALANLPPEILDIEVSVANAVATVTVLATDPGVADVLSYTFDCDSDGTDDIGPQLDNVAACPLDPSQASVTITVLVADDDGGETSGIVIATQTATLCINRYTGSATGGGVNGCPSGSTTLTLPGPDATTLCINRYTGEILWLARGNCSPVQSAHVVPDDGPLAFCQNRYTGALRYTHSGACSSVERAGVIPA